jgi:hypothetical protein
MSLCKKALEMSFSEGSESPSSHQRRSTIIKEASVPLQLPQIQVRMGQKRTSLWRGLLRSLSSEESRWCSRSIARRSQTAYTCIFLQARWVSILWAVCCLRVFTDRPYESVRQSPSTSTRAERTHLLNPSRIAWYCFRKLGPVT